MREQLMAEFKVATQEYGKARRAYREALAARKKIDVHVRETCGVASEAANIYAVLKKVIDGLPPEKPKRVEGAGEVQTLTTDDVGEVSALDLGVEDGK